MPFRYALTDWKDVVPVVLLVGGLLIILAGCIGGIICRKDRKNGKILFYIFLIGGILTFFSFFYGCANEERHYRMDLYDQAAQYQEAGQYEEAYNIFFDLYGTVGLFKDLPDRINYLYPIVQYQHGTEHLEADEYYDAFQYFDKIRDYHDASYLADYCYFKYLQEAHPDW